MACSLGASSDVSIPRVNEGTMATVIGWYVRIRTGESVDGVYDTALYIAGYLSPGEAEAAVRAVRSGIEYEYEVLKEPIADGRGPQPKPGEVRLLVGGV